MTDMLYDNFRGSTPQIQYVHGVLTVEKNLDEAHVATPVPHFNLCTRKFGAIVEKFCPFIVPVNFRNLVKNRFGIVQCVQHLFKAKFIL